MGGVPGSKVVHYDMGNLNTEFPVTLTLVAKEPCQIRHTALEAARVTANRYLMTYVGRLNFHMKLRVYPHQVLRENKQATGAGADRVSSGMRHAFGKAVGTAARVDAEQKIFSVSTAPTSVPQAKMALRRAGHKLPTPIYIVVEKGAELIK
ncbi:50S ribosomal protein L10e [Methanothrix harundinacea 6Ac]|uniref:50S ribosomal protein L10e n=2 Tax=Methanothrix harundinacea TaxID=301375 RepID=G7WMY4_METH6|nr:50S ribosomal protein L10e [Methanothrix harundinacea 6Ac]